MGAQPRLRSRDNGAGVACQRPQEAGTEIDDPEAISAVLLAGPSYMPIMEVLLGRPPGDIDPDRFRDAWLRLGRAVFTHGVPDYTGVANCVGWS